MLGPGAVGEDLAPLVGISLQFMDVDMDAARDFEREVFAGYLAGLENAGWTPAGRGRAPRLHRRDRLLLGLGAFGRSELPYLRDPASERSSSG